MLCLCQVLIYFILTKLCLGKLPENSIGKSELETSFTTSDTYTLRSAFGVWYVNLILPSVHMQDRTPATFCSDQPCLVTPVLLDVTFVRPFSHGSKWGGSQVVMRKLRMRRLYCATSVAPCCALVSSALTSYRWFRLHRQVYRFILSFFLVFFPVPFSTRTASEAAFLTPPAPPRDVQKLSCTPPGGRLVNCYRLAREDLRERRHLLKVEGVSHIITSLDPPPPPALKPVTSPPLVIIECNAV